MKTAQLIRFQEALGNKDVNLYSDLLTRHMGAQLADRITQALRVSLGGIHHRVLSFFRGAMAAVVCHGLVKESVAGLLGKAHVFGWDRILACVGTAGIPVAKMTKGGMEGPGKGGRATGQSSLLPAMLRWLCTKKS